MIKNIREEFKLMVKELDWMDDKSKEAVLEKAVEIKEKIGYPDFTYNDTYLNDMYKNVMKFCEYVWSLNLNSYFNFLPFVKYKKISMYSKMTLIWTML